MIKTVIVPKNQPLIVDCGLIGVCMLDVDLLYTYHRFVHGYPIRIEREEAANMYREMVKLELGENSGSFLLNKDCHPYLMVGCTELYRWKHYG